jgi:hypothetical protein
MEGATRERRTSRRTNLIASIALSAVLLTVVGGLAVAQAAGDITAPETIVLMNHNVKQVDVNVGSKGYGPGDSSMSVHTVFDETDQTQLGTAHIQCTVQPGKGWSFCTGAFFIDGRGEIVGEGAVQFTQSTTSIDVPITGGTGDFANVRGYVHVDFIDETTEKDTFYLLP